MRIQKLVHNPLFPQQPARPLHHLLCCAVLRAHRKYQTRPISGDSELNHSLATRKLGLPVSQQDVTTHQMEGTIWPQWSCLPEVSPIPPTARDTYFSPPVLPVSASAMLYRASLNFPWPCPAWPWVPSSQANSPAQPYLQRGAPCPTMEHTNRGRMEAMLCQTLTCHSSKAHPRTAVEGKMLPCM